MIRIFCSYAHEDKADLKVLTETHLQPLARDNRITSWDDREISGGQSWDGQIDANLDAADLIVLLLSSSFFASRYIVHGELKRALERHDRQEARVVPIVLRPVRRGSLGRLQELQILPGLDQPVHSAASLDDAWVQVAEGIGRVVDELARVSGYPTNVAQDLLACWSQLNPKHVDRHLRSTPVPPPDYSVIRSPRGTMGFRWPFRRSDIFWSERGGAYPVWGAIGGVHRRLGGSSGVLGFPVTDAGTAEKSKWVLSGSISDSKVPPTHASMTHQGCRSVRRSTGGTRTPHSQPSDGWCRVRTPGRNGRRARLSHLGRLVGRVGSGFPGAGATVRGRSDSRCPLRRRPCRVRAHVRLLSEARRSPRSVRLPHQLGDRRP